MKLTLVAVAVTAIVGMPATALAVAEPLAHKGIVSTSYDENTLPSLQRAQTLGVDVETDVTMTSDGVPVVIHDGTLDRTTDCSGAVRDLTDQWIRENCKTERQQEVVPRFDEFLAVLSQQPGQVLNVELKGGGWTANNNEKIKELRDMTFQYGVVTRTYYSAVGGPAILEGFRDSAPKIRTAWKPRLTDEFSVAAAQALSVNAVMGKGRQWTSQAQVLQFKTAGFKPWATLTNDSTRWRRLSDWGIEKILTDDPVKMMRDLQSR